MTPMERAKSLAPDNVPLQRKLAQAIHDACRAAIEFVVEECADAAVRSSNRNSVQEIREAVKIAGLKCYPVDLDLEPVRLGGLDPKPKEPD